MCLIVPKRACALYRRSPLPIRLPCLHPVLLPELRPVLGPLRIPSTLIPETTAMLQYRGVLSWAARHRRKFERHRASRLADPYLLAELACCKARATPATLALLRRLNRAQPVVTPTKSSRGGYAPSAPLTRTAQTPLSFSSTASASLTWSWRGAASVPAVALQRLGVQSVI